MSFSQDIEKWKDKALLKANDNIVNVVTDLFVSTVKLSPSKSIGATYSNDLFINQWYPSIGGTSPSLNTSTSATGEASLARINSFMASKPFLGKDSFVTLSNNLGYALRVETLGWPVGPSTNGGKWKGSTPYGMIAKSVQYVKGKYS